MDDASFAVDRYRYRCSTRWKERAEKCKRSMVTEIKETCAAKGENVEGFKIDTYRNLKIANAARQGMVKSNAEKDPVLAGTRSNGFLCWRPDLAQGKLAIVEDQDWCQNEDGSVKFPLGSLRMRED